MREMEMLKNRIKQLEGELLRTQEVARDAVQKNKNAKPKRDFVLTPYQATKIMNEARRELGLKEVNSPMLYIYARKGAFIITEGADGRKEVDEASFVEWMNAHNAKQAGAKK